MHLSLPIDNLYYILPSFPPTGRQPTYEQGKAEKELGVKQSQIVPDQLKKDLFYTPFEIQMSSLVTQNGPLLKLFEDFFFISSLLHLFWNLSYY